MRKVILPLMLAAALALSGCFGEMKTQARMDDPAILEHDAELLRGDLGVEDHLKSKPAGPIRSLQEQLMQVYPNPAIAPYQGSYVNNVIAFASQFMGAPYEYGSDRSTPDTFDCSDFTRYAFLGALGMDLPYHSRGQADYIDKFSTHTYTALNRAERGDLLFFMTYKGPYEENYRNVNPAAETITHVGIYLGEGMLLHTASQATGGVRMDYIYGKHLEWRFIKGGSVLP